MILISYLNNSKTFPAYAYRHMTLFSKRRYLPVKFSDVSLKKPPPPPSPANIIQQFPAASSIKVSTHPLQFTVLFITYNKALPKKVPRSFTGNIMTWRYFFAILWVHVKCTHVKHDDSCFEYQHFAAETSVLTRHWIYWYRDRFNRVTRH
jgi:hypothetical protein